MNNQSFVTQNEAKYRNARFSLLTIVIFSALNVISFAAFNMYFVFSAYIPLVMVSIGAGAYMASDIFLFYILFALIALALVVPYLLCWIFCKKKVGWMIAALVLFSVDSLFFLVDFVSFILSGDFSMLIDLIFRVWAIVSLVSGVKFGLKAAKEPPQPSAADFSAAAPGEYVPVEQDTVTTERKLTVTRAKSFMGCAIPMICCVDGKEIFKLKNKETNSVTVKGNSFELGVMLSNGLCSGQIIVPEGSEDLDYTATIKPGMWANKIIISPTAPKSK